MEPLSYDLAGPGGGRPSFSPYDVFMAEQGIPVYRGIGLYDVRELPMAAWVRMGGKGTFIELGGQDRLWGLYAIEIPPRAALNPERHLYEEMFIVVEGQGSAEVRRQGSAGKQAFEWKAGDNFAIPLNVWHRLVNNDSAPALLIVATSTRGMMDQFKNASFVFDNPFEFRDRFDGSEDYFRPRDEPESAPEVEGAVLRTNLLQDAARRYLPPVGDSGRRRLTPVMAGNTILGGHIGEKASGSYFVAEYHDGGSVVIMLKGKGYALNWPRALGPRPWEAGMGHLVHRQDYVAGGMVAATPYGGGWFHQHLSVGKEPLRERAITSPKRWRGAGADVDGGVAGTGQVCGVISYRDEDPQVRKDYKMALDNEGVQFQMPESVYR
ncbi:MAG: cupin domain-containing protein [Chloroflexi bacterium]|nr:cupin domain-containing protein [Chloroflexota bacterium]